VPEKLKKSNTVDVKIAGIKSGLSTYQVAWHINKQFDMQMAMNDDWKVEAENKVTSDHHHFFQYFEDVELNWYLVQNKGTASVLFQSQPLFDYFLICEGEDIFGYFERAVEAVKSDSKLDGIYPIPFSMVKKQGYFLDNIKKTRQFIESQHV
jgi:hypothetical protein